MPRLSEHLVARRVAGDEDARRALQRRTLFTVVASQVLGGAGLAAGITVGALLAKDMLGGDSLSGLPSALFTLGAASAAFLIGRISQGAGRRAGLGIGFTAGGVGAIGVVIAATTGSVPLLLLSLFVYGSGTATNLQARYAGTDLAPPARRATAASVAMVSTTLGAVAGPNLVDPLGHLAGAVGVPELAGPFMLAAAAYLAAGTVLFARLRPDPLLVAQLVADEQGREPAAGNGTVGAAGQPAERPVGDGRGVAVAATVMVVTQIAMIAIMTMTPIHMKAHGHHLGEVGLVIGIHIGFMYLPSLLTGTLVDRVGRIPMAAASGVTLFLAGLVAALAPADSLPVLIVALALLGLGWNFGLIAGTAMLVDSTPAETRARTQGTVDVLISLGGATGGAVSGLVMAGTSFATLSLAGGLLSLLLLGVLWRHASTPHPTDLSRERLRPSDT